MFHRIKLSLKAAELSLAEKLSNFVENHNLQSFMLWLFDDEGGFVSRTAEAVGIRVPILGYWILDQIGRDWDDFEDGWSLYDYPQSFIERTCLDWEPISKYFPTS